MGNLNELEKLAELRDKGILTDVEFQKEKSKILNIENSETNTQHHEPVKKNGMFNKLQQCKTCKQDVSTAAEICPHCGEKNPTMTVKKYTVGCFTFIVIIAIIITYCYGKIINKPLVSSIIGQARQTSSASPTNAFSITPKNFIEKFNASLVTVDKNNRALLPSYNNWTTTDGGITTTIEHLNASYMITFSLTNNSKIQEVDIMTIENKGSKAKMDKESAWVRSNLLTTFYLLSGNGTTVNDVNNALDDLLNQSNQNTMPTYNIKNMKISVTGYMSDANAATTTFKVIVLK